MKGMSKKIDLYLGYHKERN